MKHQSLLIVLALTLLTGCTFVQCESSKAFRGIYKSRVEANIKAGMPGAVDDLMQGYDKTIELACQVR
jgi:hypothetical protein